MIGFFLVNNFMSIQIVHNNFYHLSIPITALLVACYIELNHSHSTKNKKTRRLIKAVKKNNDCNFNSSSHF